MRKTIYSLIPFLIFTLFLTPLNAQESAKDLYQKGLGDYQNEKWEEARATWAKALEIEANNPVILFNLGLASFQLDMKGAATGYWRKALSLSPGLKSARKALTEATKDLGIQAREDAWYIYLPKRLSLPLWLGLILLSFVAAGYFLIAHLGLRKVALRDETTLPRFPWGLLLSSIALVLFFTGGTIKFFDQSRTLGTIVVGDVVAKSSPGEEGTDLFKIPEGSEVILKNVSEKWVQVDLPGGLSGWVAQKQLFQTSGVPLW